MVRFVKESLVESCAVYLVLDFYTENEIGLLATRKNKVMLAKLQLV